MRIYVKSEASTLAVDVESTDTIDTVHARFMTQHHLSFGGKKLDKTRTVQHYGIKHGMTLELHAQAAKANRIFIRMHAGKTFVVHASPVDTVNHLKALIFAQESIAVHRQNLFFVGKLLEGSKILQHYDICQDSLLDLAVVAETASSSRSASSTIQAPRARHRITIRRGRPPYSMAAEPLRGQSSQISGAMRTQPAIPPPQSAPVSQPPNTLQRVSLKSLLSPTQDAHTSPAQPRPIAPPLLPQSSPRQQPVHAHKAASLPRSPQQPLQQHLLSPSQQPLMPPSSSSAQSPSLSKSIPPQKLAFAQPPTQAQPSTQAQPPTPTKQPTPTHLEQLLEASQSPSMSPSTSDSTGEMLLTLLYEKATCQLSLKSSNTVRDVMLLVREKHDVPIISQKLVFCKESLVPVSMEGFTKLGELGLNSGCLLYLTLQSNPPHTAEKWLIHVKMLTRKSIDIEVSSTDLVRDIKDKIHELEGVAPMQQDLSFTGKQLSDTLMLFETDIKNNATLDLFFCPTPSRKSLEKNRDKTTEVAKGKIEKKLTETPIKEEYIELIVMTSSDNILPMMVKKTEMVGEVKSRIFKQKDRPTEPYYLASEGSALDEDRTLASYNVSPDMILEVKYGTPVGQKRTASSDSLSTSPYKYICIAYMDSSSQQNHINVRMPDGNGLSVWFNPSQSVKELKETIECQSPIPKENQYLVYSGSTLADNRKLSDYEIEPGEELHLSYTGNYEELLIIQIALPKASTKAWIHATANQNVLAVKKQIEARMGIAMHQLILTHGQTTLLDDGSLKSYDIATGSVLHCNYGDDITTQPVLPMTIFICKSSGNTTFPILVCPNETIEKAKRLIHKETQISIDEQILTFAGFELQETSTFMSYNIRKEYTLQLAQRTQASRRIPQSAAVQKPSLGGPIVIDDSDTDDNAEGAIQKHDALHEAGRYDPHVKTQD